MTLPEHAGGTAVPATRIRVMTVDDHPIFRDGLAALLGYYKDLASPSR